MKPGIDHPIIKEYLSKLAILWMAMLGLIAVFIIVGVFIAGGGVAGFYINEPPLTRLTIFVALLGVADIAIAFFLDRQFKSESGIGRFLSGKGVTATSSNLPPVDQLNDFVLALAILTHYFQVCVIRWALLVLVSLYGLLLLIFSGQWGYASIFYIVSVFLMVLMRSGINEFEHLVGVGKKSRDRLRK